MYDTSDYVLQSHVTSFGVRVHELPVAWRFPQLYIGLAVTAFLGVVAATTSTPPLDETLEDLKIASKNVKGRSPLRGVLRCRALQRSLPVSQIQNCCAINPFLPPGVNPGSFRIVSKNRLSRPADVRFG